MNVGNTWLAPGVPKSWLPSNMCSGLVGWEKLTWPSVWLINNMASQPPGAKSGWELENCILSSLQRKRKRAMWHKKKYTFQLKYKDTKLWPVCPGYESHIRSKMFVCSWAQRWLLYTCRDTQDRHRSRQHSTSRQLILLYPCPDLPWVNQRSFWMSVMVMRASGPAKSNLDNKPEKRCSVWIK